MNAIPKHVASTTLSELSWNATVIEGPVAARVAELKSAGAGLLKYGNGELDETLMEHGLIDEFHLFLTPAAVGRGTHLFERLEGVQHLDLVDVARFESGVLVAVYRPK
jgi:dihydrofolate reductase